MKAIMEKVRAWLEEQSEQSLVLDKDESFEMICSCIDDLGLVLDKEMIVKDGRFTIEFEPKWTDSYLVYENTGPFQRSEILKKPSFKEAEAYIELLKIERKAFLAYKRESKY